MRVNCDICGGEPAAVVCCADEAALCSACDRRVHRANKLAGKHRRIPLLHPSGGGDDESSTTTENPLCDVCKERRGLVFCVEDRAILCADCDDPIHSANDLTAKHSRFLLVGAKLSSAAIVDQEQEPSSPLDSGGESDGVPVAASPTKDTSTDKSDNSNNGGGAMIFDYLTNICPGWRVDDLLLDEHVPSMDADLFDVVGAGRQEKKEKRGAWGPPPSPWTGELRFDEVPAATQQQTAKLGRARETTTYWSTIDDSDSDVFAVPEITPPPAKKALPSSAYWRF